MRPKWLIDAVGGGSIRRFAPNCENGFDHSQANSVFYEYDNGRRDAERVVTVSMPERAMMTMHIRDRPW